MNGHNYSITIKTYLLIYSELSVQCIIYNKYIIVITLKTTGTNQMKRDYGKFGTVDVDICFRNVCSLNCRTVIL